MNSRRFELQKKKQAVRRLSSGSRISPQHSDSKRTTHATSDLRSQVLQKTILSKQGFHSKLAKTDAQFGGGFGVAPPLFSQTSHADQGEEKVTSIVQHSIEKSINPFTSSTATSNPFLTDPSASAQNAEAALSDGKIAVPAVNPFAMSAFTTGSSAFATESKTVTSETTSNWSNPFTTGLLAPSTFGSKSSFGSFEVPSVGAVSTSLPTIEGAGSRNPVSFSIKPQAVHPGNELSANERRGKRFQTSVQADDGDDVTQAHVAIRLKGIHDDLLDKEFLRSFYSKFGEIRRVFTHPSTSSAIITFYKHADAKNAKLNGKVLKDGFDPITIFWKADKQNTVKSIAKNAPKISTNTQQVDVVKKKSGAETTQLIENYVSSLVSIQARTAGEKFEVLDKIDQILREGLKKETDLSKAKVAVGTCPDICPEKERYLREDRRRLATYEFLAGTEHANTLEGEFSSVDHNKAIKEYSRSSADQEEPLPHELRPSGTLTESMNYLIFNVLDIGDGNWAEWYDFVWNRTRAIRKDITQQNLKDKASINLMEQCARFHIVCAHLLCEENINAFDAKINNENLTKCLQSLKQMYYDQMQEKNETSPNEAEFRAYQILLNLNDGNVLGEVMSFREQVRTSPEVKFALSVFSALNSTNYVRFLKLLRQAPYLAACLMHRYMNQIRASGLKIMNRAYSIVNHPSNMPVKDVCRFLAFDSEELAVEFCQHYSLDFQDGAICFSKSSFAESEQSFRTVKSGIITRKRPSTLGQVVYGGFVIIPYSLKPQSVSFDCNGIYNGTYHKIALLCLCRESSDHGKFESQVQSLQPAASSNVGQAVVVQPPQLAFGIQGMAQAPDPAIQIQSTAVDPQVQNRQELVQMMKEGIREIGRQYLLEAVDYLTKTAAADVMSRVYNVQEQSNLMLDDIISTVVAREMAELCRKTHLLERRRNLEAKRAAVNSASVDLQNAIVNDVTSSMTRQLAQEVFQKECDKVNADRLERALMDVSKETLKKYIDEEIASVGKMVLREAKDVRKKRISEGYGRVLLGRQRRIFSRWRNLFESRCRVKESLASFPPIPPLTSLDDSISELLGTPQDGNSLYDPWNHSITLKDGGSLSADTCDSLSRKRKRHRQAVEKYHRRVKIERDAWCSPLCLCDLALPDKAPVKGLGQILWKVAVSFPSTETTSFELESVKSKLGFCRQDCCYDTNNTTVRRGNYVKNNFVVRSCFEEWSCTKPDNMASFGASGLILVVDPEHSSWQSTSSRLESFLFSRPLLPCVPVLVLSLNSSSLVPAQQIRKKLGVDDAHFIQLASSFHFAVLTADDHIAFHEQVTEAVQWLFDRQPGLPPLEWDSLLVLLEKGISKFYKGTLSHWPALRESWCEEPGLLVDLFNSTIDHLRLVSTKEDLQLISWPPPQLTTFTECGITFTPWNSKSHFNLLSKSFEKLLLPELSPSCASGSWDNQLDACMTFLEHVHATIDPTDKIAWSLLLNRTLGVLKLSIRKLRPQHGHVFPWLAIIDQCILHTLDCFSASKLHDAVLKTCNVVFYKQNDFESFVPPPDFVELLNTSQQHSFLQRSMASSQQMSRSEMMNASIRDVDAQLDRIMASREADEDITASVDFNAKLKALEQELAVLKDSVTTERLKCQRSVCPTQSQFDLETDKKRRRLLRQIRKEEAGHTNSRAEQDWMNESSYFEDTDLRYISSATVER